MGAGEFVLRPAVVAEADTLTQLCLRSKAVWGYDAAFMAACRDELTVRASDFDTTLLHVATVNGVVIAMAQLSVAGQVATLEKLFVEPAQRRSGAGLALFAWATAIAAAQGAVTLVIDADPGAVPFYRRLGAVEHGRVPSGSIPGRWLPRLVVALGAARLSI
jgi:GNAT superfamily N-acetyltransferase